MLFKMPFKKDVFCNIHLLKELKWYVLHDVSSFVKYLKNNPDGSIQNFEGTETLFEYVEIGHLNKKHLILQVEVTNEIC